MNVIGVDEAGKGDYFGYLVVSAVLLDDKGADFLKKEGVRDSKNVSDNKIHKLALIVKKHPHAIVKISPEKYNALYKKFKSLNIMLAWGHARAIENVLEKNKADLVISDKFADEDILKKQLMEKGKKTKLIQKINAETETCVAAASILARDEFLTTLRKLSNEIGYPLPKGSTHVKEAAKAIIAKHGEDALKYTAKLHFKITKQLIGNH
ncbi:MAG TPA: ribonuclease HIII [archaeon]|nr:ribonuclease HIII [archaeon]